MVAEPARCSTCGIPLATQELHDSHPSGCDCNTCQAVCWSAFGIPCDPPDARDLMKQVASLKAEVTRLREIMEPKT